jgi:hypothetical protein
MHGSSFFKLEIDFSDMQKRRRFIGLRQLPDEDVDAVCADRLESVHCPAADGCGHRGDGVDFHCSWNAGLRRQDSRENSATARLSICNRLTQRPDQVHAAPAPPRSFGRATGS